MIGYAYAGISTSGLLGNALASAFAGIRPSAASKDSTLRFLFFPVFCLFTSAGRAIWFSGGYIV